MSAIKEEVNIGNIKLLRGDCLEIIPELIKGGINPTLAILDPPYFQVKGDFDFVFKDKKEWQELIENIGKLHSEFLADNATFYCFGHTNKIAYQQVILDNYFNLETVISWEKLDCQTKKGLDGFRKPAPVKEEILMYSFEGDRSGFCIIKDIMQNPFAEYLKNEFKKANVSNIEIAKLFPSATGGLTGCVSNWLNGNNIMLKEQYLKVRRYLNGEYLRKEYEELRKEYEELRRVYNPKYTNVIKNLQESNITKDYSHPTQKPPSLIEKLIFMSSRKNDLVFDAMMGSGTTAVACQNTGRKCIGIELDKNYFDIAVNRVRENARQGRLDI